MIFYGRGRGRLINIELFLISATSFHFFGGIFSQSPKTISRSRPTLLFLKIMILNTPSLFTIWPRFNHYFYFWPNFLFLWPLFKDQGFTFKAQEKDLDDTFRGNFYHFRSSTFYFSPNPFKKIKINLNLKNTTSRKAHGNTFKEKSKSSNTPQTQSHTPSNYSIALL